MSHRHLRTLIAVPTLLDSAEGVAELIDTLEGHHLANADGEIYTALVTDWADHTEEHHDDDDGLLAAPSRG